MQFRTNYNRTKADSTGEKRIGVSMTVPDDSYSIRDILERYTSGGYIPPIQNEEIYEHDDPTFNDVNPTRDGNFDLADATILSHEVNQAKQSYAKELEEITGKRKAKQKIQKEKDENDLKIYRDAQAKAKREQEKQILTGKANTDSD